MTSNPHPNEHSEVIRQLHEDTIRNTHLLSAWGKSHRSSVHTAVTAVWLVNWHGQRPNPDLPDHISISYKIQRGTEGLQRTPGNMRCEGFQSTCTTALETVGCSWTKTTFKIKEKEKETRWPLAPFLGSWSQGALHFKPQVLRKLQPGRRGHP